ncbi:MAG: ATP-binding protein, partial [Robiginitomaculum sp.]
MPPQNRTTPPAAMPPPYQGQRHAQPLQRPAAPQSLKPAPREKRFTSRENTPLDLFRKKEAPLGASAKRSIALVLSFLLFFIIMSTIALFRANAIKTEIGTVALKKATSQSAASVSDRIGAQVRWIETSIALRGSAQKIVRTAASGPNVTQVAMIDANGNILASAPSTTKVFTTVSRKNFPQSGIRLTSVISTGGVSNPVIVRKVSDVYLMTMLAPGSLIGPDAIKKRIAILDRNQKIIDGSAAIAQDGVTTGFNVTLRQISNLTAPGSRLTINDSKTGTHLTSSPVPNTDLTLVGLRKTPSFYQKSNLGIFATLFLTTIIILLALLRNALNHISNVRQNQKTVSLSEERYRIAVESSRGGVWEINLQNNTVDINPSLARILGLPEKHQTFAVSQFLTLFQPADRDRILSSARRAHMQGEMDMEVRVSHLPIVLQIRGQSSLQTSADGSMVVIGVAMDVTEQRAAQFRLKAAETRLYDALNSMTDSFVIWDSMGRLALWNGKFEDFFGFTPGQLKMGMEHGIIEHYGNNFIAEILEDQDQDQQIEIHLKDGRWIRYSEAQTADGGRVSIGTDITEIRTREEELRNNDNALRNTVNVLKKSQVRIMELAESYEQEKIRAEDANQSKSDFLANMSHELRTPLNAINGFSDIMKKEMFGPLGDPRYKEYVGDILFSGQHLLSLINDILDMSKIEAGKMSLNTDLLQINEMVSQVIRIVRGRAEDARLKLIFDNAETKEIEADPRAVKQILLNLITNAIKFTPEGGTVRVEAISKQAGIIVRIHDSGIGISKDDIARLAQPFEQIESKHSKQHEGTGLGLALSKSLVELHGGNFLMESEPGQGTVVTFTLPNRPPEMRDVTPDNEVANEITRLAEDIASVLDQNDAPIPEQHQPVQAGPADQHSAA